jgi:hypothetical protein
MMENRQAPTSRARGIVSRLLLDPHSPFAAKAEQGTFRGIDVYPVYALVRSIDESLSGYERVTGESAADPEKASLLREKILWSKFFRPFSIPTPADKLATYSMLPAEAKRRVKEPLKIWQSTQASLPPQ